MKVVDTPTLSTLIQKGRVKGFQKVILRHQEADIDPAGRHIISGARPMEGTNFIRCGTVFLKMKEKDQPVVAEMDIDAYDYYTLPDYSPHGPHPVTRPAPTSTPGT